MGKYDVTGLEKLVDVLLLNRMVTKLNLSGKYFCFSCDYIFTKIRNHVGGVDKDKSDVIIYLFFSISFWKKNVFLKLFNLFL